MPRTAYGFFNLFSAVALLLASIVAGILWDTVGSKMTFLVGSAFAFLSFIMFYLTGMRRNKTSTLTRSI